MKIYIKLTEIWIYFNLTRSSSLGCEFCGCGHNFGFYEFYSAVKIPPGAKDCKRTQHFYKTFIRRMKLS